MRERSTWESTPFAPTSETPSVASFHTANTDAGNGARFAALHKSTVRFVSDIGVWLDYDGRRWARATEGRMLRRGKQVVESMVSEALLMADEDKRRAALGWAMKSASAGKLEAMIKLASSEETLE